MPIALWYCENIGNSIVPYVLLALPVAGAYLYGQKRFRASWILILSWAAVQMVMSGFNAFSCAG